MGQREIASGNNVESTMGMGSDRYDSASFTVNTGTTDYDVDDQVAAMFTNVKKAYFTEIRTTQDISVKLNATSNTAIVIGSADSPYIIDQIAVKNIFISNASGQNATVKVLCV
jgi:hypothetical protein